MFYQAERSQLQQLIEGITRLIPGIAENMESIQNDSFNDCLLDYPHYTKPEEIDGLSVPEILACIWEPPEKSRDGDETIIRHDVFKKTRFTKIRESFKRR